MALDEPRESDKIFDIDGFKYVVDKDFLEKAQPIKIDFLEIGFKLTSSLVFEQGCTSGSCGGSCG